MSPEPGFRVFSKGTTAEGADVRHSEHWVVARRGWLRFLPDRLTLGDWVIPYADIREATLFRLKGLIGGYVLRVATEGRTFQFGINPWALRGKALPFAHQQEETRIRYSVFSTMVRIIAAAALLAWAFGKL